jgi:hypothetical protein
VEVESEDEDEYKEIEIKGKLREYRNIHPDEKYPNELMNEAIRWRLNQNDC